MHAGPSRVSATSLVAFRPKWRSGADQRQTWPSGGHSVAKNLTPADDSSNGFTSRNESSFTCAAQRQASKQPNKPCFARPQHSGRSPNGRPPLGTRAERYGASDFSARAAQRVVDRKPSCTACIVTVTARWCAEPTRTQALPPKANMEDKPEICSGRSGKRKQFRSMYLGSAMECDVSRRLPWQEGIRSERTRYR